MLIMLVLFVEDLEILLMRCEISRCCLYNAYNANTANAYIATMLIKSAVLIIRCEDAYNATANAYIATMLIMLLLLLLLMRCL